MTCQQMTEQIENNHNGAAPSSVFMFQSVLSRAAEEISASCGGFQAAVVRCRIPLKPTWRVQ
jgi:hypothetical protein